MAPQGVGADKDPVIDNLLYFSNQLDEMYAVVLSSHSTPASRLGNNRQVNITVRKSDDPFGVFQFIQPQLLFSINESKGIDIYSGIYLCYFFKTLKML